MSASFTPPNPSNSQQSDRPENAPDSHSPRDTDAVLGGNAPPPIDAAVLGGSEGIQKPWASDPPNPSNSQKSDRAENPQGSPPPRDTDSEGIQRLGASDNLDEKKSKLKEVLKAGKTGLPLFFNNLKNILGFRPSIQIEPGNLGDSECVNKPWESDNIDKKIAALKEALKVSQAGLDLLCENLKDEFLLVQLIASYALEHNKGDSTFEELLRNYPLWQPVRTIKIPFPEEKIHDGSCCEWDDCSYLPKFPFSPDKRFILCSTWVTSYNPIVPDHRDDDRDFYSFSYVLDLQSGKSEDYLKSFCNPAPNQECRTWESGHINDDGFLVYHWFDWNDRKIDSLKMIVPISQKLSESGKSILSPDGQLLFIAIEEKICIIDLKSRSFKHTLTGNSEPVENLALTPDGRTLATCDRNGNFFIWDVQTLALRQRLTGNSGPVELLALSPDGRILATTSSGLPLCIWEIETGTKYPLNESQNPDQWAYSLAISPTGQILARENRNGLQFWHIPSGELLHTIPASRVLLSQDFKRIVTSQRRSPRDSPILQVWEPQERALRTLVDRS